jgi:hypothetical protein
LSLLLVQEGPSAGAGRAPASDVACAARLNVRAFGSKDLKRMHALTMGGMEVRMPIKVPKEGGPLQHIVDALIEPTDQALDIRPKNADGTLKKRPKKPRKARK